MPDFTVKSAVTGLIRRFPSDLLETSVDPEEKQESKSNQEEECSVTPVPESQSPPPPPPPHQQDFQFTPSTLSGHTQGSSAHHQPSQPPAEEPPLSQSSEREEGTEMVRVYSAPSGTFGHNAQAAAGEVVNGNVSTRLKQI